MSAPDQAALLAALQADADGLTLEERELLGEGD